MYAEKRFVVFGVPGRRVVLFLSGVLILYGLYLISRYNYLLFHSLTEAFSIAVACSIFVFFWHSRRFLDDGYYLFMGIASLFVGGVDLLHTLAYEGMGVFPGYDANLPTQLWIAARYTQSLSFLAAPLFLRRRSRPGHVLVAYATVLCLLLGSIFYWRIFPDCFVEGTGLTPFKKVSEYVISLILVASIGLLFRRRRELDAGVFRLMAASTVLTIVSELAFTLYISVYGLFNLIGHLLKIVSFYLIYRAFIAVGLTKPYALLFRNLKQSEEALRESEERFRALVQNSSDLISIFDADGRVRYQSPALERMFGYCEEDIVGRNVLELVHPDDLSSAMEALAEVLQEPGRPVSAELRYRHNDGSWHWVEVTCSNLLGNPAVAGLVANSRDITERKQAEEAFQKSEERLRSTLESMEDLVFVLDKDGVFLDYHKPAGAQNLYLPPEVFLGRSVRDTMPLHVAELFQEALDEVAATKKVQRFDYSLTIAGEEQWFSAQLSMRRDMEGRFVGVTAVVRNITERVRAEEKIKAALREKEVLLQEIHHRVKNNLQLISSLLDLQSKAIEDPHALRVLQESRNRVRSMALVHERLYESKDLTEIDLNNLVQGLTGHLFRIYAPRTGDVILNAQIGDLSLDIAAAVPCALIINELVSNALKHAFPPERDRPEGERGEIRVEIREEAGAQTVLTVGDNGIGLPPDLNWHDPPSLGLQLVQMLTEQLGGTIELDRSAGTAFRIAFAHTK